MSIQPIVNLPYGYASGLNIAWASNTTLTVTSGACRDSTNTYDMVLSATKTINTASVGADGLDTGTLAASSGYYVFIIGDPTGYNSPATLLSLSATAPIMPTGYSIKKRIGFWNTDGSTHFILMYQTGSKNERLYMLDEPIQVLLNGTQTSFTGVGLATIVPAFDNLPVNLMTYFTPNAADDAAYIRAGGSSASNGVIVYGNVAAKIASGMVQVLAKLVTAVPTLEYKVTASGTLNTYVVSFYDTI